MHSIKDLVEKIKGFGGFRRPNLSTIPDDLYLVLIIILVAFGSFGLGRLSKIEGSKTPIRIENTPEVVVDTFSPATARGRADLAPQHRPGLRGFFAWRY